MAQDVPVWRALSPVHREVIKLSENEDVPACLPCTSAGLNVRPGAGTVSRQSAHYITTEAPKLRVCNRCCFKGLEITEEKNRLRGDGHGERGGNAAKGDVFLFIFSAWMCVYMHAETQTDGEILPSFVK